MNQPLPEGYVVHLPQSRAPLVHILGEAITIAPELSVSGFWQKERTCANCGAVRVTILTSGKEGRAWRRTADGTQICTDAAPPCDRDAGWGT